MYDFANGGAVVRQAPETASASLTGSTLPGGGYSEGHVGVFGVRDDELAATWISFDSRKPRVERFAGYYVTVIH